MQERLLFEDFTTFEPLADPALDGTAEGQFGSSNCHQEGGNTL